MPSHLQLASDELTRYVLPVYVDDERGYPDQVGTCFIVRFQGRHYLVTAAHVLEHRVRGDLYFYCGSRLKASILSGRLLTTSREGVDVAVAQLHRDISAPPYRDIEKLAFDIYQLRPRMLPRGGNEYLVLGYPATKNVFRRADSQVVMTTYTYHGPSSALSAYELLGLSEESHILIAFKQRQQFSGRGGRIDFPNPRGMSGGPILLFDSDRPIDFTFGFPVVGVATEHRRHHAAIQGTDVSVALRLIGELHSSSA